MPTAVTHNGETIKGVALEGVRIAVRSVQIRSTKFWGVSGESAIDGGYGGRDIRVPVVIYDEENTDFDTAQKLSSYIDATLNGSYVGDTGSLEITSLSDHDAFSDCMWLGFALSPQGIKLDAAGTLGGGYFAVGTLLFRQLS